MFLNGSSLEIQNHYKTIKPLFSGVLNTIQNYVIICIFDYLSNCVVKEIKKCKCYSVQVDDTTDIFNMYNYLMY